MKSQKENNDNLDSDIDKLLKEYIEIKKTKKFRKNKSECIKRKKNIRRKEKKRKRR